MASFMLAASRSVRCSSVLCESSSVRLRLPALVEMFRTFDRDLPASPSPSDLATVLPPLSSSRPDAHMQISGIHASVEACSWAQALFSFTFGWAKEQAHQSAAVGRLFDFQASVRFQILRRLNKSRSPATQAFKFLFQHGEVSRHEL